MRNFETKKDIILDAALRLIVKNGTTSITIREVAKEANVNVAAINYYFSSKEQMLVEMEKLFNDNFEEAFTALDRTDIAGEEKLIVWMDSALAYAVHYPGIFILIRDKLIVNGDKPENAEMLEKLMTRVGQVRQLFNETVGVTDEDTELFTMFASAILWPFVFSPMLFGIDESFKDSDRRKKYFQYVINFYKSKK
jgi:Transcriptional regulator